MALGEFDLIRSFFDRPGLRSHLSDVVGIGDDCALLSLHPGQQLAQSLDTLVEGIHFPKNCDPYLLGYRALAVNLSDLAAMGAKPHSFTLGLTMPESNDIWLQSFSDGLAELASTHQIGLIGGDTTLGPLTLSIQVQGTLPEAKALRRNGAKVGDLIYVSGRFGDAAGALPDVLRGESPESVRTLEQRHLLERFYRPTPRIALGQWLLENGATAALDISDGLLGDLGHILNASQVGAEVNTSLVPVSKELKSLLGLEKARKLALTGGDDYELCFTWPDRKKLLLPDSLLAENPVTCIGRITSAAGLMDAETAQPLSPRAYQHF
ncbi:thiamine-phosphate kinase [Endozoicomonas sp. 8E]|uniref:thiamine-phosphate kinase n=1 Tax=Endozoicomonas sp. 8E TaxID=3035692 RepID=UPI0029390490|nr:thiamine-phosphate kinase [Endozoicomonas sp. 8E]WOG27301.1 thiamine-phosphate kinase [Endozoicomonas sp. 8E]